VTTEEPLQWTIHLARRRPARTAVALGFILAAAVCAGWAFRSPVLGLLAAFLLTAAIADYLFPVRYRLGEDGLEARGFLLRRRMTWSQVRRVTRDHLGVKLSPLPRPSRLEAYRGIYLWFAGNEDRVMATIAHHRASEAAGGDDRQSVQHPPGAS